MNKPPPNGLSDEAALTLERITVLYEELHRVYQEELSEFIENVKQAGREIDDEREKP